MEVVKTPGELQVTMALEETDLLALIRPRGVKLAPRHQEARRSRTDVHARFNSFDGTVEFSGILLRRYPVHFSLKPGTISYGNFIKFLLRELDSLTDAAAVHAQVAAAEPMVLEDLRLNLESKLLSLDREIRSHVDDLEGIVDMFWSDFEEAADIVGKPRITSSGNARPVTKVVRSANDTRRFRLHNSQRLEPQLLSGFFSLEIERLDALIATPSRATVEEVESLVGSSFRLESEIRIEQSAMPIVAFEFGLDAEIDIQRVELRLHFGKTGEVWSDQEIAPSEIVKLDAGRYAVRAPCYVSGAGAYGVTVYARAVGSRKRVWAGPNANFRVTVSSLPSSTDSIRQERIDDIDLHRKLLMGMRSFPTFVRCVNQLQRDYRVRGLGRAIFDAATEDKELRHLFAEYYRAALEEHETKRLGISRPALKRAISSLLNVGIGEVVFVAPEGPHAIAGGLAQVIVGLLTALSKAGVSCTLISPLYEEGQGNKHLSADELINRGISLFGARVPLRDVGTVSIPLGPTRNANSGEIEAFPESALAKVYRAEHRGVRLLFLRNHRYADKLYAAGESDVQLRKAVFLSRGALELIAERRFGVRAQAIITNDWMSALVPAFLRLDRRYQSERLRAVECCHVVHNGGQGYQGRFYANQFGEDLWPLLGLADEHYFGMADPHDRSMINLTAAAVFHSRKATVAVSKPYAAQLMTAKGGEGLEGLFKERANSLFGISNGIDLVELRKVLWQQGESARRELGLAPLVRNRFSSARFIKALPAYKSAMKRGVQRRYGLDENPNAVLISLVGRLAEQKGIQLLARSANSAGNPGSVLEAVLECHADAQLLVCGPPSPNDTSVVELERAVKSTAERFPGRIKLVLDFVPHQEALEITAASDLFLMPSRFEPGGITQLEALAAGTLVVARNVGGLKATLSDYNSGSQDGNSFLFEDYTESALEQTIHRAVRTIGEPKTRQRLLERAALAENDWSHRAPKYLAILQHLSGALEVGTFPHLAPRRHLLNSLRPTP